MMRHLKSARQLPPPPPASRVQHLKSACGNASDPIALGKGDRESGPICGASSSGAPHALEPLSLPRRWAGPTTGRCMRAEASASHVGDGGHLERKRGAGCVNALVDRWAALACDLCFSLVNDAPPCAKVCRDTCRHERVTSDECNDWSGVGC